MSGGQQAENTLHENAIGWTILLAVLAVVVWVIWYYQAEEIRNAVRWLRYGEMWVISWFIEAYNFVRVMLGFSEHQYTIMFRGQPIDWATYFDATPQYNKYQLKYDHLAIFGALAMQPVKYIFMAFCGLGAYWCIFHGPQTHYRKKLGLEELIQRQSKNFPIITPFVDFNPGTQPARPPGSPVPAELPSFAEALGPEEWLAYYTIPVPDGAIDEEAAAKEFRKQLIGRWKGAMALKPHLQVLLAAFCLKAARKRSEGDDMLSRLATCWSFKGSLNLKYDKNLLKDARAVLKNKEIASATLAKCNQHAFITTAMLRALTTAREEGGVLAPAQFVWLRGYDRTLWYPLNNLGRQSYHTEALGAMSHFKMEKMTQRPIPTPKVDFAVDTIKEYMGSIRARPIPQLDYSGSKKRGVKKAV